MLPFALFVTAAGVAPLLLALATLVAGSLFAPSTFTEGGLLDDVDVTVQSAQFVLWDYDGKGPQSTFLGLELVDSEGKVHPQYFSASNPQFFVPSEDGTTLVAVGDKTTLSGSSNFAKFMQSLVNAGYPEEKMGGDNIKEILEGLECHINRVAQPKRSGLINKAGSGGGEEREKTVITVTKIHKLPWEAGKKAAPAKMGMAAAKPAAAPKPAIAGKPAGAPAGAPTKAAAAPANGVDQATIDARTTEVLVTILSENPQIAKGQLVAQAFKALGNDPLKASVVKRIYTDEFLASGGDGMWVYDGANVSLAG